MAPYYPYRYLASYSRLSLIEQSWNRVRVSRVGSGSGRVRVGFGFRFGFRIGFGSGSGSNFVCNFFKFNDLILFFERLYLQ